jgi:hypothetical protein
MARKSNDPPCHPKKHNHPDDQGRQAAPERAHVGKELLLSSTGQAEQRLTQLKESSP